MNRREKGKKVSIWSESAQAFRNFFVIFFREMERETSQAYIIF